MIMDAAVQGSLKRASEARNRTSCWVAPAHFNPCLYFILYFYPYLCPYLCLYFCLYLCLYLYMYKCLYLRKALEAMELSVLSRAGTLHPCSAAARDHAPLGVSSHSTSIAPTAGGEGPQLEGRGGTGVFLEAKHETWASLLLWMQTIVNQWNHFDWRIWNNSAEMNWACDLNLNWGRWRCQTKCNSWAEFFSLNMTDVQEWAAWGPEVLPNVSFSSSTFSSSLAKAGKVGDILFFS